MLRYVDIKQYIWVYEYVYIDFNFISCILFDICMTELFALCVLYFVRDDKIKMYNQSIIAPVRGFWSWFGGVCSLTYCNGNFRVTMVSEPFNVIL